MYFIDHVSWIHRLRITMILLKILICGQPYVDRLLNFTVCIYSFVRQMFYLPKQSENLDLRDCYGRAKPRIIAEFY